MKNYFLLVFLGASLIFGGTLFAQRGTTQTQTLEIRIASPLPQASPWGEALDRLAMEWRTATGGQVRLTVLHGGTQGDEERMLNALSANTIQAALFTSFGLSSIEPSILTVSTPFLIRDDDELIAVLDEVGSDLENRINIARNNSFFLLSWSRAGFVNFFSREPIYAPSDLQRMRIASNPQAEDMNNIFKAMGYQIVEADWTGTVQQLNTGQISAVYQNPAVIAAMNVHSTARNMLPVNIAPVLGGIVMNQAAWNRIGTLNPRYQTELLRITRSITAEFDATMPRTMNEAVQSMRRTGLIINELNPQQEQLWYNEVERAMPQLLVTAFDVDLYRKINSVLERHRAGR